MNALLEVHNLQLCLRSPMQERGEMVPLFQISHFQIAPRERVSLIGMSGTGKTLFLRSLCLLEPRSQGNLLWRERPVTPEQVPNFRAHIIYMGQRTQLPDGTVRDAFESAFRFKSHRHKHWEIEKTLSALDYFGKSRKLLDQTTESLSGGEKQLVHLLRTLALEPELLCLDEPTSALDLQTQRKYEEYIQSHYCGAWVWVTHQPDQAHRVAHRVYEMTKGEGLNCLKYRGGNSLSQVSASNDLA